MEDLTDVYNDLIMEHSMNSYNKKKLEGADYSEIGHNPNCGDEITLELKLNGNKFLTINPKRGHLYANLCNYGASANEV